MLAYLSVALSSVTGLYLANFIVTCPKLASLALTNVLLLLYAIRCSLFMLSWRAPNELAHEFMLGQPLESLSPYHVLAQNYSYEHKRFIFEAGQEEEASPVYAFVVSENDKAFANLYPGVFEAIFNLSQATTPLADLHAQTALIEAYGELATNSIINEIEDPSILMPMLEEAKKAKLRVEAEAEKTPWAHLPYYLFKSVYNRVFASENVVQPELAFVSDKTDKAFDEEDVHIPQVIEVPSSNVSSDPVDEQGPAHEEEAATYIDNELVANTTEDATLEAAVISSRVQAINIQEDSEFSSLTPKGLNSLLADAVELHVSPYILATLLVSPIRFSQSALQPVLSNPELMQDNVIGYLASLRQEQPSSDFKLNLEEWTSATKCLHPTLKNVSLIASYHDAMLYQEPALAAFMAFAQTDCMHRKITGINVFEALLPGVGAYLPAYLLAEKVADFTPLVAKQDAFDYLCAAMSKAAVNFTTFTVFPEHKDALEKGLEALYPLKLYNRHHQIYLAEIDRSTSAPFVMAVQETMAISFAFNGVFGKSGPVLLHMRSALLEDNGVLVFDAPRGIYTHISNNQTVAIPKYLAHEMIRQHATGIIYEAQQ